MIVVRCFFFFFFFFSLDVKAGREYRLDIEAWSTSIDPVCYVNSFSSNFRNDLVLSLKQSFYKV